MPEPEEKRVSTKATSVVGLAVLCSRVLNDAKHFRITPAGGRNIFLRDYKT
ncbi:MAG TPA: hypothetical protein VGI60_14795 [Chthoniobacterales bacterium]|jgi:hypothetical protein